VEVEVELDVMDALSLARREERQSCFLKCMEDLLAGLKRLKSDINADRRMNF
jgi:hypothetical protein